MLPVTRLSELFVHCALSNTVISEIGSSKTEKRNGAEESNLQAVYQFEKQHWAPDLGGLEGFRNRCHALRAKRRFHESKKRIKQRVK